MKAEKRQDAPRRDDEICNQQSINAENELWLRETGGICIVLTNRDWGQLLLPL